MTDALESKSVVLRKPTEYNSMDMVRKRNPMFFAPDLMAHFGTLIESPVHKKGLFITSDQPVGLGLDRAYTVRRAIDLYDETHDRYRPNIVNVAGGMMAHATLAEANAALEDYLTLLSLSGRPLLAAMSKSVGAASGFTAISSMTGGFTLICADTVHIMQVQKSGADSRFDQEICRVDFRSSSEAKKALAAGSQPVPAQWITNIVHASRGLPIGPVAMH